MCPWMCPWMCWIRGTAVRMPSFRTCGTANLPTCVHLQSYEQTHTLQSTGLAAILHPCHRHPSSHHLECKQPACQPVQRSTIDGMKQKPLRPIEQQTQQTQTRYQVAAGNMQSSRLACIRYPSNFTSTTNGLPRIFCTASSTLLTCKDTCHYVCAAVMTQRTESDVPQ